MTCQFRPLDWTGPSTPGAERQVARFRSTYPATLELMFREIAHLGGQHTVLQVDLRERDIRTDGLPRANARYGEHPGVILSFDSAYGPLRYATDAFTDWQDNLRAIALALEALRAVDRYGVSRRGEQYTGWKAIAAPAAAFTSPASAEEWMRTYADELRMDEDLASLPTLYKAMARRLHPDVGGTRADWDRLNEASRLLGLTR